MTEREIMMKKLSSYQFMIHDLQLYLDTHPNDEKTIIKMNEISEKYKPLKAEFEKKFGSLTTNDNAKNRWSWIKAPWPWENEEVE
ncbi:MAG: spore coat protein CotJB [Ruminococcus sp.]|nr:spore coat protein CotJB [Ruminococcus sp.]